MSDATKAVLVPTDEGAGECYHAVGGCGGHLVTSVEATAVELVADRGLRPCRANACVNAGIPTYRRCDGCGTAVFDPEEFNAASYCYACATHLHKHPSDQDHPLYGLRDPEVSVDV